MTLKSPMQISLELLSRRAYTECGLSEKLLSYGFSNEEIIECLERLKSWGYINDRDFGINRITSLMAKLKSRAYIKNDLLKNGLTLGMCDEILNMYYPEETEINIANELLKKKFNKRLKITSQGQLVLQRAGFSEDTIHHCFPNFSAP